MGQVETVAFSEDKGVGLTVYIGQRKGGASSTDTSPAALKALVKAACDIAKVSAEDPCFGLADRELMTQNYPDLDLYHVWDINPQQAIELALKCESHALSLDKRITNSDGVSVSSYESHHGYANTHGGLGFIHSTRHSLSCSLIAAEGEEMQRDYDYSTVRDAQYLASVSRYCKKCGTKSAQSIRCTTNMRLNKSLLFFLHVFQVACFPVLLMP